jgi:hypothetical protein
MRGRMPDFDAQTYGLLIARLCEARKAYDTGADAGRTGVMAALNSVIEFLRTLPEIEAEALDAPLVALTAALADLDDGTTVPLLHTSRHTGKTADSTLRQGIRAVAAATVDLLMRAGLGRDEEMKLVAARLRKAGVARLSGRGRDITARTVRGWREDARAAMGKGFVAEFYNELLAETTIAATADLRAVRRDLLGQLESVARAYRAADEQPPEISV